MNIRIALALFVLLVLSLIGSALVRPWEVPEKKIEKWKRSILVGLFTSFVVLIPIMILGWDKTYGDNVFGVFRAFGGLFICMGLPAGIIATVGFYIGYRQLEWLLKKKEKIAKKNRTNNKGNI